MVYSIPFFMSSDGSIANVTCRWSLNTSTRTCDKRSPWGGKVLSLTGETPGYPTMAEAKAAGLFHPNCRHTYSLWIEDNEVAHLAEPTPYDELGIA